MKGTIKEWLAKRPRPGKEQLLILMLSGLLLAVVAIPVEKKEKGEDTAKEEKETVTEAADAAYEERMEQKLSELLGSVEGVGAVQVMLTFEGTGEKTVEKDRTAQADGSQEETVYEERGSSERTPYVTSETNPRVAGVLVIAEGGGSSRIRQEILEAAQALFGIEAHKIKIMKMEETR